MFKHACQYVCVHEREKEKRVHKRMSMKFDRCKSTNNCIWKMIIVRGYRYNAGKFRKEVKSRLPPSLRFPPVTTLKHGIIDLEEALEATMLNLSKRQGSSSFHSNLQRQSLCSHLLNPSHHFLLLSWKVNLSIIH